MLDHSKTAPCRLLKIDWNDLQAKVEGPGHVGLPVGAEEHEHPDETAEEYPVGVQSNST